MSDNQKFIQAQPFQLAGAGGVLADTSITLQSMNDIDGTALAMTDFGNKGYLTLEPGSGVQEEQISFTGLTVNGNGTVTLSGVKSVLFKSPYTESSGLAKTHAGGTTVVISNTAGFYNELASKVNDETITGLWDFPSGASNPTIGNGAYVAPTLDTQIATKKYVDTVAVSGAPNANTTTKGIVQEATQAQVDAKTQAGSTGAELFINPSNLRSTLFNDYKVDTGAANAYVITPAPAITAYAVGQMFSFKAVNANTTTSTLNVNGLGVKTIKKIDGSTNLASGDIGAGQIVLVEYDGTNFILLTIPGSISQSLAQIGAIQMYGGSSAPTGWLLCDGSAVSRTTFAALFAILSTTYGAGDTTTTFNVPDMRGRVPVGVGTGTGGGASGTGLPSGGSALTAVSQGTWKGEENHTMTTGELVAHSHTLPITPVPGGADTTKVSNGAAVGASPSASTNSTGSSTPFNVIQPVMGVNFIIKT